MNASADRVHHGLVGSASELPVIVLAYDGVAADEAGAVVAILSSAGIAVEIATVQSRPPTSYHGRVVPTRTAGQVGTCAALVVPGGMGVRTAAADSSLIEAIATIGTGAEWLGATSTGSVLLVAAGLADGARVTTHWLAGSLITEQGVTLVNEPFVEHGRLLTASGVASTATLAFRLIGALRGHEAALVAERTHVPVAARPRRPRRPVRWRPRLRRRHRVVETLPIDPTGEADLIILDLDQTESGATH